MPPKKLPENELPGPIAALKGIRRISAHRKRRITKEEMRKKRAEDNRKHYLKKATKPDGSIIPCKDRKGKKRKGYTGGHTGSTPVMSIAWFRDYLRKPIEEILSKPRSEMSAFEAITVEAIRLALDTRGEESVIEAIQDSGAFRGRGPVRVKEGMKHILGGDAAARFFSTPEDRLKAIKHLHAYQLGSAPTTVDMKNNGGSFEPGVMPPMPFDVEVHLTHADGTREKLDRLDHLPPHPETVDEAADREARELEEETEQDEADNKPFDDLDPTRTRL